MSKIKAEKIVSKAKSYIGTKESPANSNNVVFNTHYYGKKVSGSAYPWCCAFVWDIFRLCKASELFCGGSKTAYCPDVENYYKKKKKFYGSGKAGDLCLMDFGKGRASHIGIVEKKNVDGTYTVIEGNTSLSSNDNGGAVMRRTRGKSVIRGFARPDYAATSKTWLEKLQAAIGAEVDNIAGPETLSKCPTLRKGSKGAATRLLKDKLKCGNSSKTFGKGTLKAVKTYQKKKGLAVDGIVGKNTWRKLLGL